MQLSMTYHTVAICVETLVKCVFQWPEIILLCLSERTGPPLGRILVASSSGRTVMWPQPAAGVCL